MPTVVTAASWGDFNGDNYLDLYVGGYEAGDSSSYYPDVIYTNNRNGTFTQTWTQGLDAVTTPGQPRPAHGVTTADWDQDHDLDVYVSYYRLEPNALWRNNGSGTFTDVAGSHNALAASPGYYGGHSIGAAWGDFNNDGLIDLFAGNFAHAGQPESRFLKNRGPTADYAFQDMGTRGVFYQESYASPTTGDIDNDGDLDLYFTTVYPIASFGVPNYPILFRNDGNFNFVDVTTDWGLPKSGTVATAQAAFADYDNDGYLDLMTDGKLYRNSGGTNHYLKVRLDGELFRDATAIGTQVRINLNGQTLTRQVEGAVGHGNQNDHTLHFGLGSYTGPLALQVLWPDGHAQTVNVAGVDQIITVQDRPDVPNLLMNFDSSSGVGSVAQGLVNSWTASTGQVATPWAGSASARPTVVPDVFAGGQAGIKFDGLNDLLVFSDAALPAGPSSEFTMAVVFNIPAYTASEPPYRPTWVSWGDDGNNALKEAAMAVGREVGGGDGPGRYLLFRQNGNDVHAPALKIDEATNYVAIISRDGFGNITFDLVSADSTQSAVGNGGGSNIVLERGRIGNMLDGNNSEAFLHWFNGHIGRIIMYDQQLSDTERAALILSLNSYLVTPLLGDLNGDGFVGQDDLNVVLGAWGQTVTPGNMQLGDPSGDGFVGQDDLNPVLGNWGQGVPLAAHAIPEPQSVILVVGALLCLASGILKRLTVPNKVVRSPCE